MGTSLKYEKIKRSPGPGEYEIPNKTFEGPEVKYKYLIYFFRNFQKLKKRKKNRIVYLK